ncbi:MAG: hypothetical protein ACOCUH_01390, partial [Bacteriovoracia bacterium]
ESQSETISHILVQKAKILFEKGKFKECAEDLEDAFRFAPSVSAKILKLKLYMVNGNMEEARSLFFELFKEHPMYATFIFVSLDEFKGDEINKLEYFKRLDILKNEFLQLHDQELMSSPSVVLSKIRLLKSRQQTKEAYNALSTWMQNNKTPNEVIEMEYIKLLIEMGKGEEAIKHTSNLLNKLHKSLTRHYCSQCGFNSDEIFWRCPQCHKWETIQFRWKV